MRISLSQWTLDGPCWKFRWWYAGNGDGSDNHGGGTRHRDEHEMKIEFDSISPEALQGVIENFVLQEGTDYGEREWSLMQKCEHVRRQLQRGEARIDFDPVAQTIHILPASTDRQVR